MEDPPGYNRNNRGNNNQNNNNNSNNNNNNNNNNNEEEESPPATSRAPAPYSTKPWEINLAAAGFLPTTKNYSNPAANECIICQDYTEIDSFAWACKLPDLWKLCFDGVAEQKDTASVSPPGYFNCVPLLQSLQEVRKGLGEENTLAAFLKAWEQLPPADVPVKSPGGGAKPPAPGGGAKPPAPGVGAKPPAPGGAAKPPAPGGGWKPPAPGGGGKAPAAKPEDELFTRFGRALLDQFDKARHDFREQQRQKQPGLPQVPEGQMDYIAVARLMYSWVAFSLIFSTAIEKDMNTFIGHFKSTFMTRRLSDALASGEEVCEGFARMFYALLNGATGTSYAKKISGCTRQLGGLQNPHASMILDHMWNAFPTDAEAMGRGAPGVKYKIIDPTWAIPVVVKDTNGVELPKTRPSSRSVEWSLTNAGQAVFHGPMSEALIAGVRDLVHPTWLAEYLYTDPQTLPYKNLYDMYWKTQPIWYNKDELYWIDTATVTPFNTRMTWLKDASFVVTFKNNCVHQRLNMPDTFLGYFNTDWATVKSIANKTSNILPQPKVEWQRFAPNAMDPGDTRIIWSAKLTLAPDATTFTSGTVVLAGYFDGPDLERQQEDFDPRAEGRYRPIIVWDVVVE